MSKFKKRKTNNLYMKYKKGHAENIIGIVLGIIIFFYIIYILLSSGALSSIISSFGVLGPEGTILGVLFVILLITGIFQRIFH